VTERKRTEQDRNRLFTLSLDMLCIADFDGRFRQVNPAWVKTLGWTEEELLSRPRLSFVHPEDQDATVAAVAQLVSGRPLICFQNRYRCKDGSYRRLSWNAFPLPDEKLIFAVVRDITEIQEMEERLHQAEKMEAIGQLAGGVAHDFNNQLVGILGFAGILRLRLQDEELRQCAEAIIRAAVRSADLTRQLLAFARKGKYQSIAVNVHDIIGEVAALLGRSADKRITIRQVLAVDAPMTMGDPTQLQNALLNLAINGCDAMPQGGELLLATAIVALSAEYCRGVPFEIAPGRYVQVSITDSGVGMSAEVKRHLFEPFFTTKQPGKGTGMGLAAVYGIVRNHKGAVSVNSEPGRGSTFKVYLPLLESVATMATAERIPDVGKSAQGQGRILVVDDEELILQLATMALQGLGYQVTALKDGLETVAYYREAWRHIDLVILDMVMPGSGGGEVFAAMRQINPKVKAILMSGYSINGLAQSILDQGVLGFLQKPFRIEDLAQKVAEALHAPRP